MGYTIHQGDALEKLREIESESIHCCVISPPYWGLRDYGTAQWEGGNTNCDHQIASFRASNKSTLNGGKGVGPAEKIKIDGVPFKGACGKCGATRIDQQLGLEATPEEYVSRLVDIFREVRRVLKGDGTLWLNLGDSYCTSGGNTGGASSDEFVGRAWNGVNTKRGNGLKPKDLVGIPWMVAFALRADGWYLRSDIVWSKPNPMPESVTDRPTKSHEYIFLLSKSQRYYYDAEAIAEPNQSITRPNFDGKRNLLPKGSYQGVDRCGNGCIEATRNKRTVWTVATAPFSEAHFATFPPDLIKPCILAGCPEGGVVIDPFCGAATTGVVASQWSRNFIGIELNPEYVEMGRRRIEGQQARMPLYHLLESSERQGGLLDK